MVMEARNFQLDEMQYFIIQLFQVCIASDIREGMEKLDLEKESAVVGGNLRNFDGWIYCGWGTFSALWAEGTRDSDRSPPDPHPGM